VAAGQATLAGSSKGEAGPDVFGLQVRKIAQQAQRGWKPFGRAQQREAEPNTIGQRPVQN